MTTTTASAPARRRRPLVALAKAEYLQFRRNTTLLVMGIGFPVAIPLATFFVVRNQEGVSASLATTTFEMFVLLALLFVQFYSVLSMVTTRRSEGVLKRLRTGEATDWQIQVAPMVPGAVITLVGTALVTAVVYAAGAPAPVNPVLMAIAVLAGIAIFSLLGLATSALTKNAEAAQITSLPIMALAFMGLSTLRSTFPDRLAQLADWTPFAALSDLMSIGTSGRLATAPDSATALDFSGTFAEIAEPVAILVVWTVLALELTRRNFRWDDRG
ncbi:ABC transporter permease [Aeromicrobium stalagmiti]|uniref:ABC transporter permease n=1 Tax=Aeromicrobium stalagmiti TaxID=2738988 RepID=UPI001569A1D6|nr:ABC transporter permease [Aeromicrobium stalagmiti]NRQ49606.1 ABC transporter permease [Aeromicrobium stalagmiti]